MHESVKRNFFYWNIVMIDIARDLECCNRVFLKISRSLFTTHGI